MPISSANSARAARSSGGGLGGQAARRRGEERERAQRRRGARGAEARETVPEKGVVQYIRTGDPGPEHSSPPPGHTARSAARGREGRPRPTRRRREHHGRQDPPRAPGAAPSPSAATFPFTGSASARCASPGKGIWGQPEDRDEAIRVLRRSLELGINFIDTADSYGPEVSERLIAEALYPYPKGLVIATKAGFRRPGPDQWREDGRPEYLRGQVEGSLAPAPARADRPAAAPPDRPQGAARGPARRARAAAAGREDPPYRPVGGQRGPDRGRPASWPRSSPSRISTTWPTGRARTCSTTARPRASGSFPGSRSRPATSPAGRAAGARGRAARGHSRRRWRWRGCSTARR